MVPKMSPLPFKPVIKKVRMKIDDRNKNKRESFVSIHPFCPSFYIIRGKQKTGWTSKKHLCKPAL